MRRAATRVATGALMAALALAVAACAPAIDRPVAIPTGIDPIAPTAPRGFAADLPRSPLADVVVNGGLRFPDAAAARRHCPDDDVVRVEPLSTAIHSASEPGPGAFMCKAAALQEGDRLR